MISRLVALSNYKSFNVETDHSNIINKGKIRKYLIFKKSFTCSVASLSKLGIIKKIIFPLYSDKAL